MPGKASESPRASPVGSQGSLGGHQSVPGGSLGVSRESPGGPWEVPRALGIPKGIPFGDRGPFCRSLEGPEGYPGHLWGVSAGSPGSHVASSGIPMGSLGGPKACWGPFRSLRRDFCSGPKTYKNETNRKQSKQIVETGSKSVLWSPELYLFDLTARS